MPIRYLFLDEIDAYPGEVSGEGDPVALAVKRTANFPRRKVLMTSTPTTRGLSRIEREFLATDQRRFHLPCPACGRMDWLQFTAGGWRGDQGVHHHIVFEHRDPATTRMRCSGCGADVPEWRKPWMLERGEWRPTAEASEAGAVGYHVSSLYSPLGWKSWAQCVAEFLEAREDRFRLRVWVNTVLAETFEEEGSAAEPDQIGAHREVYQAEVPDGVGALTASVDTHPDRLEAAVWGWGAGEECWLVAFEQIHGSPATDAVWHDLDRFITRGYARRGGRSMRVECAVVDSGGTHPDAVYRYAKARAGRRVFAIRGGNVPGAPLVARPSVKNRYRTKLFTLGVDAGKDMALARLLIQRPGPGYVHLPDWCDDEFVAQLASERAVHRYRRGRGAVREWVKVRPDARNEAWDLLVYGIASLHILGLGFVRSLGDRAATLATAPAARAGEVSPAPAADARPLPPRAPRRLPWAARW